MLCRPLCLPSLCNHQFLDVSNIRSKPHCGSAVVTNRGWDTTAILAHVDPHSVTKLACAEPHTQMFPTTFADDMSCILGLDVFTQPEASRREEEHCAESGRPNGQKVRFTKPSGPAVASVNKGMWRRPMLCGQPVACGDISQQKSDNTRVLSLNAGPVESMARRQKKSFQLSLATISLETKR